MSPVPQLQATEVSFLQFVSDNADYDVNTPDGKNTFHYTGGIECITPRSSVELSSTIEKIKRSVPASTIAAKHRIKIYEYEQPETRGLSLHEIQDIRKLRPLQSKDTFLLPGETLWVSGHWLKVPQHVGYNGFMELRANSSLHDVTKIKFLPFIYLKATDNNAILSTIMFGINEAKKIGQKNSFFTFDQQLYIKAREIVADVEMGQIECVQDMKNVFIRLRGFHLLMSFLGCIGKVMDDSGLQEAWTEIYAEKSTEKMLTGKNYARSLRANFYTEAALLMKILDECEITETDKRATLNAVLIEPAEDEIKSSENQQTILKQLESLDIVSKLKTKITDQMTLIGERGKTPVLWIQYIKMVSLVRSFIQAERTGNFDLHLSVIIEMLPFFHSCRHFNYAKSAHLYVQDMLQLEEKMDSPEEFEKFTRKGYNTISRKDKFFSGTSTDMIIEQSLMRLIHSIGGLFHGRGVTESVATAWLNTVNCVTYVNEDLQDFCGLTSTTSEQHKDFRESSIVQDKALLDTFIKWFTDHPPFSECSSIMSIASGVTGGPSVNCFEAEYLGVRSYERIIPVNKHQEDGTVSVQSQYFGSVKLAQEYQVVPLSVSNGSIKIGETAYPIDAKIFFDRFRRSQPDEANFPNYFQYELSPFPVSLFESVSKIRHFKNADESVFKLFDACEEPRNDNNFYVVDADTLLSLVTWPKNCTYQHLYDLYVDYIAKSYGAQSLIIFESELSTAEHPKTAEKFMATAVKICTEVYFDPTKNITKTADNLFTNYKNKTRFCTQLSETLRKCGIKVNKVKAIAGKEASSIIVNEAMSRWQENVNTVIVSNNNDILCLLVSVSNVNKKIYFHVPKTSWYSSAQLLQQYQDLAPYFPVIHALSGCKVTSNLFGASKKSAFKNFMKDRSTSIDLLKIFYTPVADLSFDLLVASGEKLIAKLYRGSVENLNDLRCSNYVKAMKAKRKKDFNLATLPPTSSAARFHILRAYWQVQTWLQKTISPMEFGWTLINCVILVPVTTILPPMPDELIGLISCKCRKDCKPRTCSCMKSGLFCTHICTECTETSCKNTMPDMTLASIDDDFDFLCDTNTDQECNMNNESNQVIDDHSDQPGASWM